MQKQGSMGNENNVIRMPCKYALLQFNVYNVINTYFILI